MNLEREPRIMSPRTDLHWAGWRSDTLTLQQNGWQLSTSVDEYDRHWSMLLKHPELDLYGVSDRVDLSAIMQMRGGGWQNGALPALRINMRLARDFKSYTIDVNFANAAPIDATPTMSYEYKMDSIRAFDIFRPMPAVKDVQRFDIEKATMAEVLEFALKRQKPRQDEIRREMAKRERLDGIKTDSQLVAELRLVA